MKKYTKKDIKKIVDETLDETIKEITEVYKEAEKDLKGTEEEKEFHMTINRFKDSLILGHYAQNIMNKIGE